MSAVGQTNALIGNVAKLLLAGVAGGGIWVGWQVTHQGSEQARKLAQQEAELTRIRDDLAARERELGEKQREIEEQQREIERLDLALRLLKVDRRVARLVVLDQAPRDGKVTTRIRFEEVGADGSPLGTAREITVDGDVVYVDAWVVKFADLHVEAGDPLRSTSLVLFRRIFGEQQAPSAGELLDPPGERPAAYGDGERMSELEARIWDDFWRLSNDPAQAAKLGVRAAHGEAPYQKVVKGEVYVVTVRASGGLTIAPDRPSPPSR